MLRGRDDRRGGAGAVRSPPSVHDVTTCPGLGSGAEVACRRHRHGRTARARRRCTGDRMQGLGAGSGADRCPGRHRAGRVARRGTTSCGRRSCRRQGDAWHGRALPHRCEARRRRSAACWPRAALVCVGAARGRGRPWRSPWSAGPAWTGSRAGPPHEDQQQDEAMRTTSARHANGRARRALRRTGCSASSRPPARGSPARGVGASYSATNGSASMPSIGPARGCGRGRRRPLRRRRSRRARWPR